MARYKSTISANRDCVILATYNWPDYRVYQWQNKATGDVFYGLVNHLDEMNNKYLTTEELSDDVREALKRPR